jgi:hypothetical protein
MIFRSQTITDSKTHRHVVLIPSKSIILDELFDDAYKVRNKSPCASPYFPGIVLFACFQEPDPTLGRYLTQTSAAISDKEDKTIADNGYLSDSDAPGLISEGSRE